MEYIEIQVVRMLTLYTISAIGKAYNEMPFNKIKGAYPSSLFGLGDISTISYNKYHEY